jgi:putative transposase
MARPLRKCLPNLTYHVFSRCIETKKLITDSMYKDLLVSIMKIALEKYEFELIFYEIMDNHFHFIIKTTSNGESISRIMQYIKARFAESYNRLNNRTGPFWNERFKDVIVEEQDNPLNYFLWLLWYLAYNPVRQNMIKDPREYKYGAINWYLNTNHKSNIRITIHEYFINLGNNFDERLKYFLFFEKLYKAKLNNWGQSP